MRPFSENETISVPTSECPIRAARRRDPVVALRVHGALHKQLTLPKQARVTVGARRDCDIVLDDPCASGLHCTIERRGAELMIVDRRSRNGTYLNGNRIEVAELRAGALLLIGRTRLVAVGRRSRDSLTAFERLLGNAPAFRTALDNTLRAASTSCSVLILGETGTGKELFARAIHDASVRSAGPFVPLNCGAISHQLISSELFGHKKGAFTGAVLDRRGVFVEADGGSLFLDELGELPRELQPNLLRVLETGSVRPVGGELDRVVDVRLIAATNQTENIGTKDATLRMDLYHRIATVVIYLPPLRERRGDIPLLVRAFIDELATKHGPRQVEPRTMQALRAHPWPGNVRELRHAVERAVTLCSDELSLEALLPRPIASLSGWHLDDPPARTRRAKDGTSDGVTQQRDQMSRALAEHGSLRRAAAALGIPKSTFADRARRLGIKVRKG